MWYSYSIHKYLVNLLASILITIETIAQNSRKFRKILLEHLKKAWWMNVPS